MLPKLHIEIERWKYNKNYNLYVSNLGNFKDKSKEDIKLKISKGGYLQVPVCNNKRGEVKYLQAHRIVMETWCPQKNMWKDKLTVDHKNHNKRDNKTKNLEWVTGEENRRRAATDEVCLDTDIEIQRLRDRVRFLEEQLYKKNIKIIIKNSEYREIRQFDSWEDAYIAFKNGMVASMNSMNAAKLRERATKFAKNGKQYFGFYWEIKEVN